MEKGEVGCNEAQELPSSPTSPTLWSSASDSITKLTDSNQVSCGPPSSSWKWPLSARWTCSVFARTETKQPKPKSFQAPVWTRNLNECAKGYPNVAAFLDSDDNFAILRRYGWLQWRLLLNKQEELRRLEQKLQQLEKMMISKNEDAFCSRDPTGILADQHEEIIQEIEIKFKEYTNLLEIAQKMTAFGKPSEADRQNVAKYIDNRKPLVQAEGDWVNYRDDLLIIKPGYEHAWLDAFVENLLKICHCRVIDFLFRSKETRDKTRITSDDMPARPPLNEDKHEIYYTRSRIEKLINGILTVIILFLLILPIYLLYHMIHDVGGRSAYMTCIGTLLIFTLAFSSVLSLFTKAKRHEILAAAAAYCAVLVVFLGNVGPPSEQAFR